MSMTPPDSAPHSLPPAPTPAPSPDQSASLKPGARIRLTIQDLAFGGEGVARLDGFVVFVPFVAPGESVEAEIVEVKKTFARARLLTVLQASPDRTTPACPYFGTCGGCQYQHLTYDSQIRLKHKQVSDIFERLGGMNPTVVRPVVPCPNPYGYRNRLMLRSQWNKQTQSLQLGFLQAESRWVVDIESCKIAEPALNEQIKHVRAHPPPRGGLKVVIRLTPEGWQVPPDSFFQNNFFLLPELVRQVRQCLRDSGVRHLLDLYCGVGFFALEMASQVDRFVGVESDRRAVDAARANQKHRAITNGDFLVGRSEDELPRLIDRFDPNETAVILDPPRTGCPPKSMELLRRVGPRQIIYVSCHPATLARDLKTLCHDDRYVLEGVTPLDMFPQTQHVECVAELRRA
jgi:tRNA/tmRNA/rRNA uracil-C5-methylase (TrmA/RlmC/RlmD family)